MAEKSKPVNYVKKPAPSSPPANRITYTGTKAQQGGATIVGSLAPELKSVETKKK